MFQTYFLDIKMFEHSFNPRKVIPICFITLGSFIVLLYQLSSNKNTSTTTAFIKSALVEPSLPIRSKGRNITKLSFTTSRPVILLWTTFFNHKDYYFGLGHEAFIINKCPVTNCDMTADKSRYDESDAIVIHMREVNNNTLPAYRFPNQYWVFFLFESPINSKVNTIFNGLFNWTATYRLDSDVYMPYLFFDKLDESSTRPDTNINYASGKSNTVLWLVSNCHTSSNRMSYAKVLAEYIHIEQYGHCNSRYCDDACYKSLQGKFKFYLAFENSICKDYLTEKIKFAYVNGMVPIVLGGSIYENVLPSNSYLDVKNFTSIRKLGEFLNVLNANDTLYNQYFAWRQAYRKPVPDDWKRSQLCKLCAKLNEPNRPSKTYADIVTWWHRDVCLSSQQYYKGIDFSGK